jgi:RHS repeat-associated protein
MTLLTRSRKVLVAFLAVISASAALGQSDPPDGSDVFDQFFRYTEAEHHEFYTGLPDETVDPLTGTLRLVQTDIRLPGKAGLDLVLTRSYSSKIWSRADDQATLIADAERSILGYGWSFHMGRLRDPYALGGNALCTGTFPVMEMPDGSVHVFYPGIQANGDFISKDYWVLRTCTVRDGSTGSCVLSTSGTRYEFSRANQYSYTSPGASYPILPASLIADRFGNYISMQYLPNSAGAMSRVTDTYNRTISFTYSSASDGDRLSTMVVNGKTYRYDYTTANGSRVLSAVRPPVGAAFQYTYNNTSYAYDNNFGSVQVSGSPSNEAKHNQWALSSYRTPNGGRTEYTYTDSDYYHGIPGSMVSMPVLATKTQFDRNGASLGTWTYYYSASQEGDDVCNPYNITSILRPDGRWDTYWMYGFGSVQAGSVWKVGLTYRISRGMPFKCIDWVGCGAGSSAGTELVTNTWTAGTPISPAYYSAPAYSSCNIQDNPPLYDSVVYPTQMAERSVYRDGRSWTTKYGGGDAYGYGGFDAYGQPLYVFEGLPIQGTGEPSSGRQTKWAYAYAPSLNVVRGLPVSQVVQLVSDDTDSSYRNSWTYDIQYAKSSETQSGVTTRFGYDAYHNLSSVTNALGQSISIAGYEVGNGTPTAFNYNGAFSTYRTASWEGWVTSETDSNGNTMGHEYDAIGRPAADYPPGSSNYTSYTYAPDGSGMTLTHGSYIKTTAYDGFGRVTSTVDNVQVQTATSYDKMGRKSFVSYPYPVGATASGDAYAYDGLCRIVSVIKADGTSASTQWAGTDYRTTVVRAPQDSASTWYFYKAYGSPDSQGLLNGVTDANTNHYSYSYNATGQLHQVAGGVVSRAYLYDSHQFLTSRTEQETGTTTFTRNAIGQSTSKTDARSVKVTYTYDPVLGRLTATTFGAGSPDDTTITYDNNKNVKTRSTPNGGAFAYTYDELNRLVSQNWTFGGHTFVTSYVYDPNGCLASITYPSGSVVSMTCDIANRTSSISLNGSVLVEDVTYHPSGQVSRMTYGNGTNTSLAFDSRGRPTSVAAPGVMGLSLGYDGVNNVLSYDDTEVPGSARTMAYNNLNQLSESVAPALWGAAVYDYDLAGNRTLSSVGSNTTTFMFDGHNYIKYAVGYTQKIVPMSFTYDLAGRLATSSDGTSYYYDATGKRVRKTDPTGTTLYHYDALGRVIGETSADGTKIRDFVYFGGRLLVVDGCVGSAGTGCSDRQWYHTDSLGSVLARTDASGAVVARFQYQPWGEPWSASPVPGDRQFNGQTFDSSTGFYDYGARTYAPQLGRFLTADSYPGDLSNPASLNLYAYVLNNPYRFVDPSGHAGLDPGELDAAGAELVDLAEEYSPEAADLMETAGDWFREMSDAAGELETKMWDATEGWLTEAFGKPGDFGQATPQQVGQYGQQWLQDNLAAGKPNAYFDTPFGARFVDYLNSAANEVKVGYQSLTTFIQSQINKDSYLLNSGTVPQVNWYFLMNPQTGVGGPSQPLVDELVDQGFNVYIDYGLLNQ